MSIVAYENFNGHSLQIIEENGELWFIANQVAEAVEYKNPRQATSDLLERNPTDFEGLYQSKQIAYAGQLREVTLLNEEGLYLFCMLSKTPKATQFRRWVAKFLKTFRQNKLALVNTELSSLSKKYDKLEADNRFIGTEYKFLRDDLSTLARAVKILELEKVKELNRCITTEQVYIMRKAQWKLADRISILKGEGPAGYEMKKTLWKKLKIALKIDIYFKYELFSVKQFNAAMDWIQETNKNLDLRLEGLV